ncbi:hypothetical protein PM082_019852 [Marasmius tenuissimus]|nr:hypothetical protein PM082_019852 [Marasmius tenuissimus]
MDEDIILSQSEESCDDYEGDSVDDNLIKKTLDDALHQSEKEVAHAFRSWKAAIDREDPNAGDDSDTPHLLAVLLEGEYPRIPKYDPFLSQGKLDREYCPLKVSSLQEPDRTTTGQASQNISG